MRSAFPAGFPGYDLSPQGAVWCKHTVLAASLGHPILGSRLSDCIDALLLVIDKSAHEIFGSPDDLKLKSSMTLFAQVSPESAMFDLVLDKYFDGQQDVKTIELVQNDLR